MPRRTTRRSTRQAPRRGSTEPSEPEASDTEEVASTKDDTGGAKEISTPKRRGGGRSTRSVESKPSTRKRKRGRTSDTVSDEEDPQETVSSEDDNKGGGTTGDEMSISSKGTISKGSKASMEKDSHGSEESEVDSKQRKGRSSGGRQRSSKRPQRKKRKANKEDEDDGSSSRAGSQSKPSARRSVRRTRRSHKEDEKESGASGEDKQESSDSSEGDDAVPSTRRSTRRTRRSQKARKKELGSSDEDNQESGDSSEDQDTPPSTKRTTRRTRRSQQVEKKESGSSDEADRESSESSEDEETAFRRSSKTGEISAGNIVSGRRRARSKYASEDDSDRRPAPGSKALANEKESGRTKQAKIVADKGKEQSSGFSGDDYSNDEDSARRVTESRDSELAASKAAAPQMVTQPPVEADSKNRNGETEAAEPHSTVSSIATVEKESKDGAISTEKALSYPAVKETTTAESASSSLVPSHSKGDNSPECVADDVEDTPEELQDHAVKNSEESKAPSGDVVSPGNVATVRSHAEKEAGLDAKSSAPPSSISQMLDENMDSTESKSPSGSGEKEANSVPQEKSESRANSLNQPQISLVENPEATIEAESAPIVHEKRPEKNDVVEISAQAQSTQEAQSPAIGMDSSNDADVIRKEGGSVTSGFHNAASTKDGGKGRETMTFSESQKAEPPSNAASTRREEIEQQKLTGDTRAVGADGSLKATTTKMESEDGKLGNEPLSETITPAPAKTSQLEHDSSDQTGIRENVTEKLGDDPLDKESQAHSNGAPGGVQSLKQLPNSHKGTLQTSRSTPHTTKDSSIPLVNKTTGALENANAASKVSLENTTMETEILLKTEPSEHHRLPETSPNKANVTGKSAVEQGLVDRQSHDTTTLRSEPQKASTLNDRTVPDDTIDNSVVEPKDSNGPNSIVSTPNLDGSIASTESTEISKTGRPDSSADHVSPDIELVTQSLSPVEVDRSLVPGNERKADVAEAEKVGKTKEDAPQLSPAWARLSPGPIKKYQGKEPNPDTTAGPLPHLSQTTMDVGQTSGGDAMAVDTTSGRTDIELSTENLVEASQSSKSVQVQEAKEDASSLALDTNIGQTVANADSKPSDQPIMKNDDVSPGPAQDLASAPGYSMETSTQLPQDENADAVVSIRVTPIVNPLHKPVVNGVIPTMFSSEKSQKLQSIRQQDNGESETKENETVESTSSPVPFPIILEGLSSRGVDRSPRAKLESYKFRVLREARRVHGAHVAERMFAEYWACLQEQIHGSGGSAKVTSFLRRFLRGKSLRRAHNKLILGIVKKCESPTASYDDIVEFVPERLKSKLTRAGACVTISTDDSVKLDLNQLHVHSQVGKKPLVTFDAKNTPQATATPEKRIQLRVPGALAIDPVVRAAAMQESLKVSETVVWLLVVAAKEYATQIIKSCANVKKAACQGIHLRVPQPRPHTLMYKPKPGELKKHSSESVRKPMFTGNLCISSLDVHTLLTQLPMGPVHSIGGTVSRMSYETTLMNSVDIGASFTPNGFEELRRFVVSRTLSHKSGAGPARGGSAGRLSPHGGLGRGAKDLASLRARSSATSKKEADTVSSSAERKTHSGDPPASHALETEEKGEKESDEQSGVRKGKGSGVKNLRAMIARTQPQNPSDDSGAQEAGGATSMGATGSTPNPTETQDT